MAEPIQPRESARGDAVEPAKTEVLTYDSTADQPTVVVETAPKKKRRRWLGWVIALGILLVLLVVGFFVGDAFAKQFATQYVRDQIIQVLHLDPDSDVEVDLGGGSVILQALAGGLNEVTIHANEITFGDITGDAQIVATGVPLDSSKPVDTLGIQVSVNEENVQKLRSFLSGIDLTSITLEDDVIRVGTEFQILVFAIPVSVDLLPTAQDGGINFDPRTIILGEEEISVDDLRASPEFRALAGDLLNSQQFCIAEFLPEALILDDVKVVGKELVLTINGDGTALADPGLSSNGVCPKK
ncbi:hypothetical protein BH10ACT7_BH10ACT7_24810 [soil metagenome]